MPEKFRFVPLFTQKRCVLEQKRLKNQWKLSSLLASEGRRPLSAMTWVHFNNIFYPKFAKVHRVGTKEQQSSDFTISRRKTSTGGVHAPCRDEVLPQGRGDNPPKLVKGTWIQNHATTVWWWPTDENRQRRTSEEWLENPANAWTLKQDTRITNGLSHFLCIHASFWL